MGHKDDLSAAFDCLQRSNHGVKNESIVEVVFRLINEQGSFALQSGDLLVLFTDGISESMNSDDEEWGEERLIELAKTCTGMPAIEAMNCIVTAAQRFAAGAPQHDDMTVVVLRVIAS